jgi:plasmid stabilization system protein ParE
MNTEQGFTLHPGAAQDITDIWEFILEDNPLAARRVREDILDAIRKLVPFPHQGHKRPDLTTKPLRFQAVRNNCRSICLRSRWLNISPRCKRSKVDLLRLAMTNSPHFLELPGSARLAIRTQSL